MKNLQYCTLPRYTRHLLYMQPDIVEMHSFLFSVVLGIIRITISEYVRDLLYRNTIDNLLLLNYRNSYLIRLSVENLFIICRS